MEEMKKKRLLAVAIDFSIACLMALVVERIINFFVEPIPPFALFSLMWATYFSLYWFLCKDCYGGMSPGKRIMGIQVINLKNLCIASPLKCIIRDLCSCFGLIELIILLSSPQGLRIGDYLTSTRVVIRNRNLQQKHGLAIFTFIIFFVIWIAGIISSYIRLKTSI